MRQLIALSLATLVASAGVASAQNNDRYRSFKPSVTKQTVAPAAVRNPGGGGRGPGNYGGGGGGRGPYGGGGFRGPGYGGLGVAIPGIIMGLPGAVPSDPIDDADYGNYPPPGARQGPPPPRNNTARRGPSGVPPANERRMVPDEVVIEVPNTITPQAITALERRHRLARIESQSFALSGTTMFRWRIPDRRSVAAVVRALETDGAVASAQPNYVFALQQSGETQPAASGPAPAQDNLGDKLQYFVGKLRLTEAHGVATGGNVTVAVIDSGIDGNHPELAGAIADSYDALDKPFAPHAHGTAIAALIAGHSKLMGAAPTARILAIRAFDPAGQSAEATTFNILKGPS